MTNATQHPHHPSCPGGDMCTLDSGSTDAKLVERRGWSVGTRIECALPDGRRRELILTAIGRECILAVEALKHTRANEYAWTLVNHCWGEVQP